MTHRERVHEAGRAVDEAIDLLNAMPRHYGGHLEWQGTSVIDGVARLDADYRRLLFRLGYVLPE